MGYGHDGSLGATVPEHPSESRLQRAVLCPTRPRGRFDERRAQPAVALSHLAGLVLPGTLIVSRTEGGPAREVARAGKRAHVHADLRDDDLRGALIDPGNAIQPRQRVGERGDHRLHLPAQNPDGFIQIVEVRQQLPDQERVMPPEASRDDALHFAYRDRVLTVVAAPSRKRYRCSPGGSRSATWRASGAFLEPPPTAWPYSTRRGISARAWTLAALSASLVTAPVIRSPSTGRRSGRTAR